MSEREMNLADASKQAPRCEKCSRTKIKADGIGWLCANCDSTNEEKTGQTLIHTNPGSDGPMKWTIVKNGSVAPTIPPVGAPQAAAVSNAAAPGMPSPGTVAINVPVQILPEFVLWARKLKMPKDWREAEKFKAIVDFQVHVNKKLEDLSQ